jgi:predicted Rossmann fold nucleotide-binding protein DprA/Smf involved in DNA uptake
VSVGANRLIRDGAAPYLEPADLLQHFPDAKPLEVPTHVGAERTARLPDTLTAEEREVALLLGAELVQVDELAARSGRGISGLLAVLCALEIASVAEQLPGKQFRRMGPP